MFITCLLKKIKNKFTGINNFKLIKKIMKKDVYKNNKNFKNK